MSSSANTADTGNTPPEIAFPRTKMSALVSYLFSQFPAHPQLPQVANNLPVRAMPVCTSSAMKSTLLSVHSFLTPARYPSSGTNTPASPCIGSTINPATLGS